MSSQHEKATRHDGSCLNVAGVRAGNHIRSGKAGVFLVADDQRETGGEMTLAQVLERADLGGLSGVREVLSD